MNKDLAENVLNKWAEVKSKVNNLKKENNRLKFQVNLLLTLIGFGLITWILSAIIK